MLERKIPISYDENELEEAFNQEEKAPENDGFMPIGHKPKQKRTRYLVIAAILAILFVISAKESIHVQRALNATEIGKNTITQGVAEMSDLRFAEGHVRVAAGLGHLKEARENIDQVYFLRIIPGLGRQIKAADSLIAASISATEGLSYVSDWVSELPIDMKGETITSVDPLVSQKTFEKLVEFPSLVLKVDDLFNQTLESLNEIPDTFVSNDILEARDILGLQVGMVHQALADYIPIAEALPHITGATEKKNYLWILMNNDELRPTGGYISAYALTGFGSGKLQTFVVDNSRNLDTGIGSTSKVAPQPIQKYDSDHNRGTSLLFHDSSWSPDFPTAAKEMVELFVEQMQKQGTSPDAIDGVVAITPTFIGKFLDITGPVEVGQYTVTAGNVADILEIDSHRGFRERGLTEQDRKQLIFDLGNVLLKTLGKRGVSEWITLSSVFEAGMNEKHLMIFHTDEKVQSHVRDHGWDGSVAQPTSGDFLMVTDANLGSFKSDIGIKRSVDYSVDLRSQTPKATLTIEYQNKNSLIWKTRPIYTTYLQVYVPKGAVLTKATGIGLSRVTVSEELAKSTYGMIVQVPIGRKKTITLEYDLPKDVAGDGYNLYVQKQPGTVNVPLVVDVKSPRSLNIQPTAGTQIRENGTRYTTSTTLTTDQSFGFSL